MPGGVPVLFLSGFALLAVAMVGSLLLPGAPASARPAGPAREPAAPIAARQSPDSPQALASAVGLTVGDSKQSPAPPPGANRPGPATPELITAGTYAFTSATGASLEDLSVGATQLLGASQDDTASAVTNIGFDVWFDGLRYSQFSVNGNSLLRLGPTVVNNGATGRTNNFADGQNEPKISPYWDDLCTSSTGQVRYKVLGSAPSRKLVVEFQNMITYNAGCTAGTLLGSFQTWIYELTHATTPGVVEFVYGAIPANPNVNTGYSVGISSAAASFASITTTGPSVSYAASNNAQVAAIASGTKYTFTPNMPAAPTGLSFTGVTADGHDPQLDRQRHQRSGLRDLQLHRWDELYLPDPDGGQ